MVSRVIAVAVLAASTLLHSPNAAGQDAPPTAPVELIRDHKLLSVRPKIISGTVPDDLSLVRAAEAAGRGGRAKVTAIVTTAGTLREVQISESSGDSAIDGAILAAMQGWKLTVPRDLAGNRVEAVAVLSFAIGAGANKLSGDQPALPEAAKALGHNGEVVVKAVIAHSGLPTDVALAQSSQSPLLDAAALEAVRGWRFARPLDLLGRERTINVLMPLSSARPRRGEDPFSQDSRLMAVLPS